MHDLLRLATAGSVDDGKSTLVGRLLHDARAVLADQLAAVERASRDRGMDDIDLSLLTDGLRAEREQGITIDVAYRYFATARRTFVLADTPGHVQYTRNTVTGMSTAEAAVLLVDARQGAVEQTRRHAAVAALLRVPHLVLAVNKMDLVDWDPAVFTATAEDVATYAKGLGVDDVTAVPVSALHGDNIVDRSTRSPWYDGPTLLQHLEEVQVGREPAREPLRYPVQYVLRDNGVRWYAGQLASGVLRPGDEVTVLPSGQRTKVVAVDRLGRRTDIAYAPMSVAVALADDLDVARGDLLVRPGEEPATTRELAATVCWLAERPLRGADRLLVKHTTRTVRAILTSIEHRLDVDSLGREPTDALQLNDVGGVVLRTAEPLAPDDYVDDRQTGSFLLVDEQDGSTLGAGLVGQPTGPSAPFDARCSTA
jgi:sulfate adenylyltransferase subunit 1